jgi:VIT1/CCC1 family predicted Fe2+/Mn2+ transporter
VDQGLDCGLTIVQRCVVPVNSLKRGAAFAAGGLCLLALAVFMVLTSTATIVITLAILAAVILGLFRLVLAGSEDAHKPNPGR